MPKPNNANAILAKLFHRILDNEETVSSAFIETRSNTLREWYRKGQACYRNSLEGHKPVLLDGYLQGIENHVEREGFLMGWQSDAYADQHSLGLSIQGVDRQEYEGANFAWED